VTGRRGRRRKKLLDDFDVCVTLHHIWKWREVPTWYNKLTHSAQDYTPAP